MDRESLLDELASGEDEFDVDLMACGCRLVASPAGRESAVTISQYLQETPGLDAAALRTLVEQLVEANNIPDRTFIESVDRVSAELPERPTEPIPREPVRRPRFRWPWQRRG